MRDVWSAGRAMPTVFAIMFCVLLAQAALSYAYPPGDPKHFRFGWTVLAHAVASSLAVGAFAAPFAVLIHRRIILGEDGGISRLVGLRDRIADFYVACVGLQLAFLAPTSVLTFATQSHASIWVVLALLVVVLVGTYGLLRMLLLFPAIAVDGPHKNLCSAFRRSRGLAWRSLAIGLVIGLSAMAISGALGFVVGKTLPGLRPGFSIAFGALENLVLSAASVAIASRFYIWRIDADATGSFGEDRHALPAGAVNGS